MFPEPVSIPPLSYAEHYWVAENDGMQSRRAMSAASGVYQSAVVPEIADISLSLPTEVAADIEEAAAALASFDAYTVAKLGGNNSTLGPMTSILLRTESASSSQIENITVSARQLALAEIGQSVSVNAKTVIGNVRTMEAATALAEHINTQTILDMHRELLLGQPGWETYAGRFRNQLVWIGSSGVSPLGAIHVAPQPEYVAPAISDLVAFVARDDIPVIAQMAIAHAQFETIHPFADGNGRTGRALVHAIMRNKGLVTRTTAPVSAGLLAKTADYFAALTRYRQGDARPIIERFADASRYASSSGIQLVDELSHHVTNNRNKLSAMRLHSNAGAWSILPLLVANPVIDSKFLRERLNMGHQAALSALTQLENADILTETSGFRRNRVWQHTGILTTLDAYAAKIYRH